jgi:hypothetical protein
MAFEVWFSLKTRDYTRIAGKNKGLSAKFWEFLEYGFVLVKKKPWNQSISCAPCGKAGQWWTEDRAMAVAR